MFKYFGIEVIRRDVSQQQYSSKSLNKIKIRKNVKKIEKCAFRNNFLKKLDLVNLLLLEEEAFKNNKIEKLILSPNLIVIYKQTFENNYIKELDLLNIRLIEEKAFKDNKLEKLSTKNVESIGDYAFYSNIIKELEINEKLEFIGISAFERNIIKNLKLNNRIKTIGKSSFAFNSIEEIIIPKNVRIIEDQAFKNNNIKKLILHNEIEKIGKYCFFSNKIKEIKIPTSISSIEEGCFYDNAITSLYIPSNIEVIKENAFRKNKISNIIIEEGVKAIESQAFLDNNINKIKLPNSLEIIGQDIVECEIIYKDITFSKAEIKKLGTCNLRKMVQIKKMIPNFDLLTITKEELNFLPNDLPNLKGYMNNRKRFRKLSEKLNVTEKTKFDILTGLDIKLEYLLLVKLSFTLGYFRLNGKDLDNLEKDILKIYSLSSTDEIEKMTIEIYDNKYKEQLAKIVRKTLNNPLEFQKIQYYYSYIYNNFEKIRKGIIKKNEQEIARLNTEYKKTNNKEIKIKHDQLKITKKNININDLEKFIVEDTFESEIKELEKIIPYLTGNLDKEQFLKLEKIYKQSLKINSNVFKTLKGSYNEYNYEWLNNTDPLNLILGYLLHCCSKLDGAGEDIMIQSMINPKIKNLVVYDSSNKVLAKSTAFYNGNYIICNNIEVAESFNESSKTTYEQKLKLLNTLKEGLIAQANELEDIEEIIIGMKKNDLQDILIKEAIEIVKEGLKTNYKYKNYSGDANDPSCGQAIIYKK